MNTLTWEAARAGGLVAYGLLSLSVVLGLVLGLRTASRRWPRLITNELHRFLTLATLVFVCLHVLSVGIDPFTHFGPTDVLVPFASRYRPLWLGLGIVAFYLSLAVWITTLLRARIGFRWWRRLHFTSFAVYAAATLHGLATGTDTRAVWALALYAVSATAVGSLTIRRLMAAPRGAPRPLAAATGIALLLAGVTWTIAGPLQHGWGRHHRTLLARATVPRAAPKSPSVPSGVVRPPFAASFRGHLTVGRPSEAGLITLRIDGALRGGTRDHLEILLHGVPLEDGGVRLEASRVLMGTTTPLYDGSVDALDGSTLLATLRSPHGSLRLGIVLTILRNGRVEGRIRGEPA